MTEPKDATTLHTADFLELRRSQHWEYVRRVNSSGGAAFMVATTQDQELVLVEQLRLPVNRPVIELPAGIIGDHDESEDPATAALRELEEETGFRANNIRPLYDGPTAAGITCEWAWHFRLSDLTRVHSGGGVDDENIITHVVPIREIHAWLATQQAQGKAICSRIYAALYWLALEND
ncbi:MAG: NUDIX hydrolase [Oceanococcus sp.]